MTTYKQMQDGRWMQVPERWVIEPRCERCHEPLSHDGDHVCPEVKHAECVPTEGTEPRQCAGCTAMIAWEPERAYCVYCEHRCNLEALSCDYVENIPLSEPLDLRIRQAHEPVEEHAFERPGFEWP